MRDTQDITHIREQVRVMIKGHIRNKGTCDEHHKDIYETDKLIRRIYTDFYMMPMHPPKMGNFTKMAGKKILQWGGGGAGVQGVQGCRCGG